MALLPDRLRRLSEQTARESGLVIDDCREYDLSGLYVERDIEPEIIRQVRTAPGCTVLVGEAGSGKTSLLWHIHQRLLDSDTAIFLRAEIAADLDPDELCGTLAQLWSVKGRPILLIDTADAVVGIPRHRRALMEVIDGASTMGCATIVSSRPREAAQFLPGYEKTPIPDRYSEREFAQIVETHTRHFYQQPDVEPVSKQVANILAIVSQGQPVADLVTRPLLLRMLFSLYGPYGIPSDINTARLYETYWQRRVRSDWRAGRPEPEPDSPDLAQTALTIAYKMVLDGTLRLTRQRARGMLEEVRGPLTDVDHLVSRGVLRYVSSELEADSVDFFHQTFFEYAAARSLIDYHGADAIDLLVNRLRAHVDDHLRLPIVEHVLILSHSLDGMVRIKGQERIEQILKDGPPHLQRAAVTAYAQMPSSTPQLQKSLHACLEDSDLAVSFVRATPSVPLTRSDEVWDYFRQIWAVSTTKSASRRPWAARVAVLEQLVRLALREQQSASDVAAFLQDYRVIESIEVDKVESAARLLTALAEWKPGESLRLLEKLLRRLDSEFSAHENATVPVLLAIARHPNATPDLLQTIIDRLSSSTYDYINRVRGVVQAVLWRQDKLEVQEILTTIARLGGGVRELSALAAWLSGELENVWDQVWSYFVLNTETLACREWVRHVWDRLGLQPADKGDVPSVRASRYFTSRAASAIGGVSAAERRASLLLCRYSVSFELRVAILRAVLEDSSVVQSTHTLCASDALGLLLGPGIAVRAPGTREIIQRRLPLPEETQSRLMEDVDSVITRAPEYANDLVLFLIYSGEFPRIEHIIAEDDLTFLALPREAASTFSTAIMKMLQSPSPKKRQTGARLAFHGLASGLGVTLEFDEVVPVIASEPDPRALGWLAMVLCKLAETSAQVDTALTWAFLASKGDEYVRDKAFEALLDLVITKERVDCLDSILEAAERPTLNLRRILAVVDAVPRIAVFDPRVAAQLAHRALTLPSLQTSGTPVLGSLRNQGKKPLIQWTQRADVGDLLALVAAIPSLAGRVGRLILDVLYRPPHTSALRDAIISLAHHPDVPTEVKHHIPIVFQRQSDVAYSDRWEELLVVTAGESYDCTVTWDTFIAFASGDQAFAVSLKKEFEAHGRKAFCSAVDLHGTPPWDKAIHDAQHGAHTTVVLLTLDAIASSHVNTEIQRAITWNQHVVPVPLDSAMQDWTAWPSGLSLTTAARGTPAEVAATVAAGALAPGAPDHSTLHARLMRRTESELDAFSIELGIDRAHLPGGIRTTSELASRILDLASDNAKVAAVMRKKRWLSPDKKQFTVSLDESLNHAEISDVHPNIRVLMTRMDDSLRRNDFAGVLHASASIFETMAKDVVGIRSIQDQTLKSFFDRYRKDSNLPNEILDYVLGVYELRNTTPLAGHGSTQTAAMDRAAGVSLAEMTRAFIRIEYTLRGTET